MSETSRVVETLTTGRLDILTLEIVMLSSMDLLVVRLKACDTFGVSTSEKRVLLTRDVIEAEVSPVIEYVAVGLDTSVFIVEE